MIKDCRTGQRANIAYHRTRLRKTVSLSSLTSSADADQAFNMLIAAYESFGNTSSLASTTQVANAKGALVEQLAK
jgi:hypothetical protein